ncbi:restriction endonuclease, partial [Rhizobium leguminosarum]|nr:restriction endonuclease [Rhizobium ruizarguesonis]
PEVVNLVFFKPVYSATKFWQMMGRGTRLRLNLFGDGIHKDKFRVFDFGGNARFFMEQQPEDPGIGRQVSLSEKLFLSRAALVSQLDQRDDAPVDLRNALAADLHASVSQISPKHIQVRPLDRPVLEHYQQV